MKVKTAVAIVLSLGLANFVHAENNSEWLPITSTAEYEWYGKLESGSVTNVDNKKNNGYAYVFQKTEKNSKKITYGKVVVLLEACKKGYGYIYFNDLAGNFDSRAQFVRFGNTVGDALGTMACTSWDNDTKKVSMQAQENAWEEVAKSEDGEIELYIKKDTFRKIDHKGKKSISILRASYKPKKEWTDYHEMIAHISDCKTGYGKAYYLNFDRQEAFSSDYVVGGDSIGAAAVTELCKKL